MAKTIRELNEALDKYINEQEINEISDDLVKRARRARFIDREIARENDKFNDSTAKTRRQRQNAEDKYDNLNDLINKREKSKQVRAAAQDPNVVKGWYLADDEWIYENAKVEEPQYDTVNVFMSKISASKFRLDILNGKVHVGGRWDLTCLQDILDVLEEWGLQEIAPNQYMLDQL